MSMKITKEAAKAWKAEYEKINEMEREELKKRLATETVEHSIKTYFALVNLVTAVSGSTDVPSELQELQEKHYIEDLNKWKLLSERLGHV